MNTITEETTDEDLPQYWESIIFRLNEKTGWNLNSKNSATIDQLLQKINPKDDKPETHAKAKQIWRTTLVCVDKLGKFVQKFGAIIASGASVAFGPANQCFNAISFVISAAQQYNEVFSKITTLMERVSVFLENLNIFMTNDNADVKLDKRLRKSVYRILEHFLKIMSTTYELTNSWRARQKLKATIFAFSEDSGISGYLGTLETLVSDFTGAQISVIVQGVSQAAKDLRSMDRKLDMLADAAEMQAAAAEKQTTMLEQLTVAAASSDAEARRQKELESIRKALGISEKAAEDSRNNDRQDELWETHVPGSGQWLLQKNYFTRWADAKATAANDTARAISQVSSSITFKTSMARFPHTLAQQTCADKPPGGDRGDVQVVVAYYYIQRDTAERSSPFLRTLLWQLANSNADYRKAAAKACEAPDVRIDPSNLQELSQRLIIDISKQVDATFFIVIDGLDGTENNKDVQNIALVVKQVNAVANDKSAHLRIRAFISGNTLDSIASDVKAGAVEIDLEPDAEGDEAVVNQLDLESFVADRVEKAERLKGLNVELKDRIRRELARGVRGDYSRLTYLLDDLRAIQNTTDIDEILSRATQSRTEIVKGNVDTLDKTLTRNEIKELNTVMSWLYAAFTPLTVGQFEAALSLRAGGQSVGLDARIKSKYQPVLSLEDDDKVRFRDGVAGYLEQMDKDNSTHNEMTRASTAAIQAPEVTLVSKLLKTHLRSIFGDEDVYLRFEFDDFFEKKLGDQAVRIRLSPEESNVLTAQGCLVTICDKSEDERGGVLLDYACEWFIEHLGKVDLKKTDALTKRSYSALQDIHLLKHRLTFSHIVEDMGRKLTRLLTEDTLMDVWWAPGRMWFGQILFYDESSQNLASMIHRFLKDPTVQKGLVDMPTERQWVAKITAGEKPSFEMYGNLARSVAKRLFDTPEDYEPFMLLYAYTKLLGGTVPAMEDQITKEVTDMVIAYAQEQLGNSDQVFEWHVCKAWTLMRFELWEDAINEFRPAIELKPSWKLKRALGEALGNNSEYKEAITTTQALVDEYQSLSGTDEEYTSAYWEMLNDVGSWAIQAKDYALAQDVYQQGLKRAMEEQDMTPSAHGAISGMLSIYNKQSKYSEAMALLDQCFERRDSTGTSWTALLLREYYISDEFHNQVAVVTKRTGKLEYISQLYEHAIASVGSPESNEVMGLQHYLASLLWIMGTPDQQEQALTLFERIAHATPSDEITLLLKLNATRHLAPALLESSRKQAPDVPAPLDLTSTHVERLKHLTTVNLGPMAQASMDPRLLLARAYHLAGNHEHAKEILRHQLKQAFNEVASGAVGSLTGFYNVAVILQAIDDDDNAVTAWCQYTPHDYFKDGADQGDPSPKGSVDGQAVEGAQQPPDASATEQAKDVNGMQEDSTAQPVLTTSSDDGAATQVVNGADHADDDGESQTKLKGSMNNFCDGRCNKNWTYADNIYICQDCLDVQFDEDCYRLLQAGQLDLAICSPNHKHLHVPPFDVKAWRARAEDEVLVGGTVMARQEWIENVKKEWEIDEETLETKYDAARRIQRAWRSFKILRLASRRRDESTA